MKSWAKFIVRGSGMFWGNENVFYASSRKSAKSFQKYWGGEIIPYNP